MKALDLEEERGRGGIEVRKGVAEAEEVVAAAEVVAVAEADDWDKRGLKGNLPVSPAIALSCGRGQWRVGVWRFFFFKKMEKKIKKEKKNLIHDSLNLDRTQLYSSFFIGRSFF